jgi:hypothetical protein
MEENVTQNASTEATPNVETQPTTSEVSMESGGSVSGEKLSLLAIMMLGLTTASLIYSIHYYRKKVESLKRGEFQLKKMKEDIDALKRKLTNTNKGNRTRYGRMA